jgi:hypothetical protein
MTRNKAAATQLQASKIPYDINENGDTLFTCPRAWSVTRKINKLISVLYVEPVMQATYLALNPDCDPETFFMGRSLWEKMLVSARTDVFVRFYMMLKHCEEYKHLWTHNKGWICSPCANGFTHPWLMENGGQWLCQLATLQDGERVVSELIMFTYIRFTSWTGPTE